MRSYLAGDSGLPQARVKSVNTAAYVLPDLSDASASTLGDNDPVMLLQPGINVSIIGPSAQNAHGVSYTPIQVVGDPRTFWARSSDVLPIASAPVAAAPSYTPTAMAPISNWQSSFKLPSASAPVSPARPVWEYVAVAIGMGAVGYGVYKIMTGGVVQPRMRFAR